MRVDGKAIAQHILDHLTEQVTLLREEGVTPHVAVVLIGDDESSKAYVRQKELKINQIGGAITTYRFKSDFQEHELLELIDKLNNDPIVHGIVIQRPLPSHIDTHKVTLATAPEKDIDSFRDDSPFDPPIGLAVMRILRDIHTNVDELGLKLDEWLKRQKIVLVGKGHTAGQPIIKTLSRHEIPVTVINSTTEHPETLLIEADIVISAVGKRDVIKPEHVKDGAILIGVGMFRGEDNKLHGDYDDEAVAEKASYFTPVPGGVGPVNVAMLLANLIKAAEEK